LASCQTEELVVIVDIPGWAHIYNFICLLNQAFSFCNGLKARFALVALNVYSELAKAGVLDIHAVERV
jgi:hypothetical protein